MNRYLKKITDWLKADEVDTLQKNCKHRFIRVASNGKVYCEACGMNLTGDYWIEMRKTARKTEIILKPKEM